MAFTNQPLEDRNVWAMSLPATSAARSSSYNLPWSVIAKCVTVIHYPQSGPATEATTTATKCLLAARVCNFYPATAAEREIEFNGNGNKTNYQGWDRYSASSPTVGIKSYMPVPDWVEIKCTIRQTWCMRKSPTWSNNSNELDRYNKQQFTLTDQDLNGRSAGEHRTSLWEVMTLTTCKTIANIQYTSIYYDETTSQYKDTRCNQ